MVASSLVLERHCDCSKSSFNNARCDCESCPNLEPKSGCRRAKQKRERLRSAHLAPDYIPLGGAAGLTASSNAEAAARLRGDSGGGGDAAGAGGDAHSDDEEPEAEDALRMQFMGADRPDKARARARAGMQARPAPSHDIGWGGKQRLQLTVQSGSIPSAVMPLEFPHRGLEAVRAVGSNPPVIRHVVCMSSSVDINAILILTLNTYSNHGSVCARQERGQQGEEDDDAWVRQQIRAGAGRGLSAAQAPAAATASAPAGGRSAADVFTAAPPQRSAAGTAAATPEHVAAAAAAVMTSLQTSMRQLQASVPLGHNVSCLTVPCGESMAASRTLGLRHGLRAAPANAAAPTGRSTALTTELSTCSCAPDARKLAQQNSGVGLELHPSNDPPLFRMDPQASHQHVRKELGRTSQQLMDSIASVGGLDEDLAAAKAKYTYMQEVRGYIADLCDMLQVRRDA